MVRRFLFGKEAYMQEEIEEKAVRLAITTTKLSARTMVIVTGIISMPTIKDMAVRIARDSCLQERE